MTWEILVAQERLRSCFTNTSFDAWRLNIDLHDVWQVSFDFIPNKLISVEPVQENIFTDTGLLNFRQWDYKLGFTECFSQQLDDRRYDPDHSILEMSVVVPLASSPDMKTRTIMIPCVVMLSSSYRPIV